MTNVFVSLNSNRLWIFIIYLHAYSLSLISMCFNVQHVTKDILDTTVVTLVLLHIMVRSVRQRATVLITSIVITYMDVYNHKVNVTEWWSFPFFLHTVMISFIFVGINFCGLIENHSLKDNLPIIPAIHILLEIASQRSLTFNFVIKLNNEIHIFFYFTIVDKSHYQK